ncbi:class I SAM-dependent methyltransferase [Halococcus sediminicola]|uniref:class I SAM-dependent methyltransferase n=1 Tax=Halococcus sediminicola TaxID=1264579 RepID=UPI000679E24E|nr:methyltransferase domain-containing protein [Halococcus sediminicola]
MSERGQSIYNWWSRHERLFSRLYDVGFLGRKTELRERAVEALNLDSGERVLELDCGPGNSFDTLRTRVGGRGNIVGVDYTHGMVERAAERVQKAGWKNVYPIRGDSGHPGVDDEAFDAVYASMTLSAMANPVGALDAAYRALRPGGRIVVLDAQPFQAFPWTLLNPVIVPLSKYATNWFPEANVPEALDARFGATRVTAFNGGTIFIAAARKPEQNDDR